MTPDTSISDRYEKLVDSKRKAGLSRETAEKSSYDQIVQDGIGGLIDQLAAIDFLMSLEMTKGASEVGAAHIVKPLFNRL